ncbi:MAG TPA: hypothetical protein VKB38_12510 [Terracidiphilus sp.]|nr:hypothetical protein [Terracidiphilus sp.]
MSMPWSKLQGPAKVAAICAAVLLVSAGLCGAQLLVLNFAAGRSNSLGTAFIVTGALELIAIILSAAVGVIALLIWGIGKIVGRGNPS